MSLPACLRRPSPEPQHHCEERMHYCWKVFYLASLGRLTAILSQPYVFSRAIRHPLEYIPDFFLLTIIDQIVFHKQLADYQMERNGGQSNLVQPTRTNERLLYKIGSRLKLEGSYVLMKMKSPLDYLILFFDFNPICKKNQALKEKKHMYFWEECPL